jgi:hypothetical protein
MEAACCSMVGASDHQSTTQSVTCPPRWKRCGVSAGGEQRSGGGITGGTGSPGGLCGLPRKLLKPLISRLCHPSELRGAVDPPGAPSALPGPGPRAGLRPGHSSGIALKSTMTAASASQVSAMVRDVERPPLHRLLPLAGDEPLPACPTAVWVADLWHSQGGDIPAAPPLLTPPPRFAARGPSSSDGSLTHAGQAALPPWGLGLAGGL